MKQGLSASAYAILQARLVLGDGCTQTEICKHTLLNKQTVWFLTSQFSAVIVYMANQLNLLDKLVAFIDKIKNRNKKV